MSTDHLLEGELGEELDDDAYFADLAAGTATPASALADPDEPAGTAGRAGGQPAAAVAPRQPPAKGHRRGRVTDGLKRRAGALHEARARLAASSRRAAGGSGAHEGAEEPLEENTVELDAAAVAAPETDPARRWRPRRAHLVSAGALLAAIVAISAGSQRPVAGPAKARGPANGTPVVRGPADLRLAWRAPSDARPRELTLGGRLTVGPGRTPVVGARLDVLAGDQAGTARQLARVRTDKRGRFRLALSIAGRPPGLLTVSFLARRGDTVPAALASARLRVRSAAPPSRKRRSPRRAARRGQTKEKNR